MTTSTFYAAKKGFPVSLDTHTTLRRLQGFLMVVLLVSISGAAFGQFSPTCDQEDLGIKLWTRLI